jgi:hypothetical protein
MFQRRIFFTLSVAVLALATGFVLPALSQDTLYNNGPDGNIGYYHVNFGAVATNSFSLSNSATITGANLIVYCVDDRNAPERLKWTITTEPLGGAVMGEGFVYLTVLDSPYPTKFQFFAWPVGFSIHNLTLPAGTYYLQIQDVMTLWDTFAFWAQSSDGSSQAYYEPIAGNGAGGVSEVPSESFSLLGEWSSAQASRANHR